MGIIAAIFGRSVSSSFSRTREFTETLRCSWMLENDHGTCLGRMDRAGEGLERAGEARKAGAAAVDGDIEGAAADELNEEELNFIAKVRRRPEEEALLSAARARAAAAMPGSMRSWAEEAREEGEKPGQKLFPSSFEAFFCLFFNGLL